MTAWTDFVKKYSAEKGISYKAALSQASGPYKSRKPETKAETKPTKGTVQVKRNVAQRGLADIATKQVKRDVAQRGLAEIAAKQQKKQQKSDAERDEAMLPVNVKKREVSYNKYKAQRDLEDITRKAQKKAYIKRVGLPEDLIQDYVDLNGVFGRYVGLEFIQTPKRIQTAVDRFESVLTSLSREISDGRNGVEDVSPEDFFDPYDDYGELGYDLDSDDEDNPDYYMVWNSDALDYIRGFTTTAKDLLKKIIDYKSGKDYDR